MHSDPHIEELTQLIEGLCKLQAWQGELLGGATELLEGRSAGGNSPRAGRAIQPGKTGTKKKQ